MTPYMVRNMGFKKWVTKRKKWVTKNKVFFPLLTATTTRLPNGYSPIHYKRLTDQDYPFWIISIIASHTAIFLWIFFSKTGNRTRATCLEAISLQTILID
jgi:hypothetical protein